MDKETTRKVLVAKGAEAIAYFDFKKARKIFKKMKWTYYGDTESPSKDELVATVWKLFNSALEDAVENEYEAIHGTGRFEVAVDPIHTLVRITLIGEEIIVV